jgi:hypothetical protein
MISLEKLTKLEVDSYQDNHGSKTSMKSYLFQKMMDKTNSKMIDYKTFLAIMNGHTNIAQSENFNWVSDAI